jgi:hypothetical protein
MKIDCQRRRPNARVIAWAEVMKHPINAWFVGGLFLLAATAVLLGACQQPSAPPGQSSTVQQKQYGTGDAGRDRHCCRHAGKNNSK